MIPSSNACAGAAVAACVSSINCSLVGSIGNGRRHAKASAVFSYGCWTARTISSGAGSSAVKPHPMSHLIRLSNASAPCRLDWRPSRWMIVGLGLLGVLAALSLVASEMPRLFAWPFALMTVIYTAWQVWRECRRQTHQLVWPIDGAPLLDGLALQDAQLHWRGPLAFLRWHDGEGRRRHLAWWPDTLPSRSRRELRLAAASIAGTRRSASMAP